jgi:hypothetical protein
MRAARSVAATAVLTALGLFAGSAAAATAPPQPPKWVRQVIAALPTVKQGEGSEDVEVRAAGQTQGIENDFSFDTTAGYLSSRIGTPDSLDDLLTLYASHGTAYLDVADAGFRDRLPAGKRFVTLPVADLTADGLASTDTHTWFAPLYVLLGVAHAKLKPLEGAGQHVYAFDVDLAAAKRAVPAAVRPAFLRSYGQIPTGKGTTAHGSATVDDQHVVREFEVRFSVNAAPHPLRLTVDVNLDTVNSSVQTTVPPDSVSVPIDSVPGLREQLQKLTGGATPNPVTGSS